MGTVADSHSLFDACLQEGSEAQVRAFEMLWDYLYRIAYGMLHDCRDGEGLAADCTQIALIKIHRNLSQCREPRYFRSWAVQILRRAVIDEVRRQRRSREVPLEPNVDSNTVAAVSFGESFVELADLQTLLREAIAQAPLSDRSRRVVVGRYFNDQSDEVLAQIESQLAGAQVLPCHIQVTRSKNLSKLRQNASLVERLRDFLDEL